MMTPGKVYLVGAGPGDPGLLTCRGRDILQNADVVVYDRLIGAELLALCRDDALQIYVGKAAGRHSMTQDEINEVLSDHALQGQSVCRLKGGDPFVFGRGGEEALHCLAHGIPFEIVPGVTSAVAAPAYAGIPVTHREVATSFAVVTGHTKEGAPAHLPKADTLIFLMGIKALPEIVENLLKEGRAATTPAAVIRWGTTMQQQVVTGNLSDIEERIKAAKLTTPALIVVGEVVHLREQLQWFDNSANRPLWGKTVVVTRAREQASTLVAELSGLGAKVIQCPTIRIAPLENDDALQNAIDNIAAYSWIIFTSTNGVGAFWERISERGCDARLLADAKIVAIGPATASALAKHGIKADLIPATSISESVADEMIRKGAAGKVLLVRALQGREVLQEKLAAAGMQVALAPCYQTVADNSKAEEVRTLLKEGKIDWVTFTSSSTVINFVEAIGEDTIKATRESFHVACIGPITAKTADENNLSADVIASGSGTAELAAALCEAEPGRGTS
jgi:uroporphyrinogen III methyltransferase/synthase